MTAEWVRCALCGRCKAPVGRSVPLEMCLTLCTPPRHPCEPLFGPTDGCEGYYKAPRPECRWPGEEQCGPGCDRS